MALELNVAQTVKFGFVACGIKLHRVRSKITQEKRGKARPQLIILLCENTI
jgi:hypothetical protein